MLDLWESSLALASGSALALPMAARTSRMTPPVRGERYALVSDGQDPHAPTPSPVAGMPVSRALAAHALGAGLTLVSAAYRFTSPQTERVQELVWVWIVASALYLVAAVLATRRESLPAGAVVFWALAMRAFSLGHAPELTTDYHRYLWDAKVQQAGINPYVHAPADPELKHLRDDNWREINFRSVPTIYPPVSQFVFRVAYLAGGLDALRLLFLTFEVLGWACIVVLLRRQGRPDGLLALFAWCPSVVLEVAFNLHQDVIGASLLLAALALSGAPAGAALALSVLAKGYAALLFPVLVRFWRGRFVAAFLAVGRAVVLDTGGLRLVRGPHARSRDCVGGVPPVRRCVPRDRGGTRHPPHQATPH